MPEHKLISLCLETSDRIVVNVTLLKEASHYKMRTEYLKEDDKIKETNDEVARNLVSVSYTHLDVYKRQASEPSLASAGLAGSLTLVSLLPSEYSILKA